MSLERLLLPMLKSMGNLIICPFTTNDNFKFFRVEDIESDWFREHVKQVRNMLPGGQEIQGIFTVSKNANVTGNPKSKNKVFECCKVIQNLRETESSTPLAFLQIDSKTQNVKAELIVTSDQAKTKSLSFETGEINWLCLKANLILDLPLAFTQEQSDRPLSQKLETAVKRLSNSLDSAVFMINDNFMENDQLLDPTSKNVKEQSSTKKKGKKAHHKEETTEDEDYDLESSRKSKEYNVDILFDEDGTKECVVAEISGRMNIMGKDSIVEFTEFFYHKDFT